MSLDSLNKKAIALSPETFGVAFQYAPIGIALVGPRGKFLAVNEALCRLLKYTEEELLAIDFPTVTHPDDRDGDLEMARTLSAGEAPSFEMEKRYVTKAGALVWVLVTVGCIRNAKGAIEYYIAQVKDNTEERRAKEALEKATEFQRLVLEHSRDLIFVKNEACEITMANQAMLNMYPQERQDQVIGHTTVEDYPPAEARAFLANDRYALEHGHHETQETISFPDGSERTLLTSKTRFYDEAGEPFILGIARDISPIKTAEATLRRHTKLLELAEQTANLGHWRYNLEDESLHWSDEIFNIHGVSRKTYQPDVATAINYYHPDDRPHVQHVLGRTISRQEPFEFELRVIRPSNEIIHVQSRGWPELDRDGGVRAVFGTFLDITQRKEAELALLEANKELEKFAYIASHDLRSPLRAIGNLTHWISEDLEGVITDDARGKLALLRARVQRMDDMLNDILAYSRAGRISERPMAINLSELIQEQFGKLAPDAFALRLDGDLPTIRSPRGPLAQVFQNLLSNAVKHHDREAGTIEAASRHRGGFVEIAIRDDGPGIDEEYHQKVFEMFQTLAPRDRVEGTGLGMPLIRKLVESQGGEVWIESPAQNRGTTVKFTWPRSVYQGTEAAA